jgi:hypothetical protein
LVFGLICLVILSLSIHFDKDILNYPEQLKSTLIKVLSPSGLKAVMPTNRKLAVREQPNTFTNHMVNFVRVVSLCFLAQAASYSEFF